MKNESYAGKTLLITGGTGSFGSAVLKRFLNSSLGEIRIFSRDEKKQDDMRRIYQSEKLKFYIGDVRDPRSLTGAMRGSNFVFHAAALKQVPSCEFFPVEAVKTNILGTQNVIDSAAENSVEKLVCLSTDKAVYPINAMGMSKALMEKLVVAKTRDISSSLTICLTRYGNVMASRGSVIPLFLEQIKNKTPITITNGDMTRFMMTLDDAVELVLYAFENGNNGDIFVQKSPAATVDTLVKSILAHAGLQQHPITYIGTRHGEKLYETLCSTEEMSVAIDEGSYYRIPRDQRDQNYSKYFEIGDQNLSAIEEYNSHNTTRLNELETFELLKKLPIIRDLKKEEMY